MKRKTVFSLITAVVPILFLLLTEGTLRLIGYGSDLELVVPREILGHRFLSINRQAGKRYFSDSGIAIPEPPDDFFLPEKPLGSLRIFCVGESTMAGFPYEYTSTAPAILKSILEREIPGRTVEVINAGMSAIGSAVVADMVRQLVRYQPDIIIVYVGHNEFYGTFGAASSQGVAFTPLLTDLYLRMLHLRTVLLLRDILNTFQTVEKSHSVSPLMETLAEDASIRQEDEVYRRCRERFASHLREIIETSNNAGAEVLVSFPVSNLSGLPPFHPLRRPMKPDEAERFDRLLAEAHDSLQSPDSSIARIRSALSMDGGNASLWFELGQHLRKKSRNAEALEAFTKARDLDGLRFRMSSDFGEELLDVCRRQGVHVSRLDSSFAGASPGGVCGPELFLEHVHPNIAGYILTAQTWARDVLSTDPGKAHADYEAPKPLHEDLSPITAFDHAMGRIRIAYLLHQWPFRQKAEPYQYNARNDIEEITLRYVRGQLTWQAARYELASLFVRQGQFALARNEAYAVSRVLPFSYEPLLRIADYYLMEGRKEEALAAYQRCVATEENPYAYSKLGLLYLEREDMSRTIAAIRKALQLQAASDYKLPLKVLASNHHILGYALIRQGDLAGGKEELRQALMLDPDLAEAQKLLSDLGG